MSVTIIGFDGCQAKDNKEYSLSLCHIEYFRLGRERNRNGLYIRALIHREHRDKYPFGSFHILGCKNKFARKLRDIILKHGKIVTHGCNMGSYVATANTKDIKSTHPEVDKLFEKEFYRQDAEKMEKENEEIEAIHTC